MVSPQKLHPPLNVAKIFSLSVRMNILQICSDGCSFSLSLFQTGHSAIYILQLLFISNQTLVTSNSAEVSQSTKFYSFSTYFNAATLRKSHRLQFKKKKLAKLGDAIASKKLIVQWLCQRRVWSGCNLKGQIVACTESVANAPAESGFREICQFQLEIASLQATCRLPR